MAGEHAGAQSVSKVRSRSPRALIQEVSEMELSHHRAPHAAPQSLLVENELGNAPDIGPAYADQCCC